jgi:hypothetical protein
LEAATSLDVNAASNMYRLAETRFVNTDFGVVPYYESGIANGNDVKYVDI